MKTQLVTLKFGFSVGDEKLNNVVLREPTVGDMIAAEELSPKGGPIAFRSALICVCIEKLEGFDGSVTLKMLGELKLADYNLLVDGLSALEETGEANSKKD